MADQVLTKQKLIDADEDVQALEDVVNGEPGQLIKTRLGREVYTLASVPQINTMTREEVDSALSLKAPQATTYTKLEVDSALSLKAPQATTYTKLEVDTTFAAYVGGRKAYTTLALAQADQANLTANTAIEVTNDGANNGAYQWNGTTLTKSDYDPLTQAKNYTDAYATVKSKTIANGTDFNTLNVEGAYKVESNTSALTMTNCPSTRAGVLEVLQINASILIQRYTPYNIENKVYYRTSNNSVWPTEWQEFLIKSEAGLLFTTRDQISESVSSAISAVTQSSYFGEKFSESEILGSAFYTIGTYVGYNSIHDTDIVFNAIECRIINQTAGDIEYRVYFGNKVNDSGANGYRVSSQANIGNPDFSGVCKSFPSSDNGEAQLIVLDKAVSIPKDTPFVIVFKATDLTKFNIAYASAVTGNLESRSFNLSTLTNDWADLTQIGNASVANGYVQAGFKLLVSIPQQSGGGVTPEPTIHVPDLVLPPKIYALAGLQTHIYPEHILPEDANLYEHDIVCSVGKQVNRGFRWDVPAGQVAGTHSLTWKLFDKAQGKELASASGSIVVGNSAKSGNINACVIGDSYINAGVITQGLLDLSASDPLKINLIGTRGTGLNKHEGRGGWTIADYATVGRTYYAFTVSGVTTTPAINSTVYEFDGGTFTVQELNLSGGSGTIVCSYSGTAPTNGTSGTLAKKSGAGDTSIAFSNIQSQSGNPFWINGAINFTQYLTNNSLATPDYVFIQLGVNDSFRLTSDADVESLTATAFAQLDSLITSIKAANSNVKIGLMMAPTYASQDAFGANYASNYTAFRAKRNIVIWNRKLIEYYKTKENTGVYLVGSGFNVDAIENFPITEGLQVNSRNPKLVSMQNNAAHPSNYGYLQISDVTFSFIKAV